MIDLHIIANLFLTCGKEIVLVPLIILGFLTLDRRIFGHATFLLLFAMIFNVLLKSTFQVPLSTHLNKVGYAFPSGHMHSAMVFYGWLLLNVKNSLIRIMLGLLLAGIAFGLIYQQYHDIYDILGAVIFGGITLLIYFPLSRSKVFVNKPFLLGYIIIALSAGIMWYINRTETISSHVWMAFMVLCGFTASWTIFAKSITTNPPFLSAIIGFACIIGIYYLTIILKDWTNIDYNFQWVVVGILIPLTARIAGNYRIKK